MSYIRFENIVKSFGSNTVLKDINLEVEKGQLLSAADRRTALMDNDADDPISPRYLPSL